MATPMREPKAVVWGGGSWGTSLHGFNDRCCCVGAVKLWSAKLLMGISW